MRKRKIGFHGQDLVDGLGNLVNRASDEMRLAANDLSLSIERNSIHSQDIIEFPSQVREYFGVLEPQAKRSLQERKYAARHLIEDNPDLYEEAFYAAQERMPLPDKAPASMRRTYEKAWRDTASWILGNSLLGDEPVTKHEQKLETERLAKDQASPQREATVLRLAKAPEQLEIDQHEKLINKILAALSVNEVRIIPDKKLRQFTVGQLESELTSLENETNGASEPKMLELNGRVTDLLTELSRSTIDKDRPINELAADFGERVKTTYENRYHQKEPRKVLEEQFSVIVGGIVDELNRGALSTTEKDAVRVRVAKELNEIILNWESLDQTSFEPQTGMFKSAAEAIEGTADIVPGSPLHEEIRKRAYQSIERFNKRTGTKQEARAAESAVVAQAEQDPEEIKKLAEYQKKVEAELAQLKGDPKAAKGFFKAASLAKIHLGRIVNSNRIKSLGKKQALLKEGVKVEEKSSTLEEVQNRIAQELASFDQIEVGLLHVNRRSGDLKYIGRLELSGLGVSRPLELSETTASDLAKWANEGYHSTRLTAPLRLMRDSFSTWLENEVQKFGDAQVSLIFGDNPSQRGHSLEKVGNRILKELGRQVALQENYGKPHTAENRKYEKPENDAEKKAEGWGQKELDKYFEKLAEVNQKLMAAVEGVSVDSHGIITGPTSDKLLKAVSFPSDDDEGQRFVVRLRQLLREKDMLVHAKADKMRRLAGVKDVKIIFGAVVATFNDKEISRKEWADIAHGVHDTGGDSLGTILVKVNAPAGTIRHELAHHIIGLGDYLASIDNRLGMASAYRRNKSEVLFGPQNADKGSQEAFKKDGSIYEKLTGRPFNEKEDGVIFRRQQGVMEEFAAWLFALDTSSGTPAEWEWLNIDNSNLYSARDYKKTGKSLELIGNDARDVEAMDKLVAYFQYLKTCELGSLPVAWTTPAFLEDRKKTWDMAVAMVSAARTVIQAEKQVSRLIAEFESQHIANLAKKPVFQTQFKRIFPS